MSADAERRSELQRRAFAPGGGLTHEEAAELRMLSQPADAVAEPADVPREDAPEPVETSRDEPVPPAPARETDAAPARPRWLIPVVLLVALVVGLGVGWLVTPHPAHAEAPRDGRRAAEGVRRARGGRRFRQGIGGLRG